MLSEERTSHVLLAVEAETYVEHLEAFDLMNIGMPK